jgi:CubicO group peptidase (beta-lactamase class C family)
MGIEPPAWSWSNDTGVIYAGGDQRMTPREMLKFGATYLNAGVWDGQRIVSEQWVEQSANPYPGRDSRWLNHSLRPIPPGDSTWGQRGYSYTWWTHVYSHAGKKFPTFWALGWGGQKIVVFPDHDAVVVITGGNYTSADNTAKILTKYVIPALE